jgi:hypothetical protein
MSKLDIVSPILPYFLHIKMKVHHLFLTKRIGLEKIQGQSIFSAFRRENTKSYAMYVNTHQLRLVRRKMTVNKKSFLRSAFKDVHQIHT